jgi:hypothetical protein
MGTCWGASVIEPEQWLPPVVTLADHSGDWTAYLEAQYDLFRSTLVTSKPTIFHPKRWALKKHPLSFNKEATFWHVTSEGKTESDRTPDMRRMERVGWIRPMIDAHRSEKHLCWWQTKRDSKSRPTIAVSDFSYIVVLQENDDYVLLWTAFYVEQQYRRDAYRRQWREAKNLEKAGAAPFGTAL